MPVSPMSFRSRECRARRIWILPEKSARPRNFPTFHAARIQDVATARHAIASGKVDIIGMTRAHMTDPHIVRKISEKREDDIRPCVGANYCLDRIYQGGAAYCIHNAATGRETTMPHEIAKADRRKKSLWWAPGRADWRPRASRRNAGMKSSSLRRRAKPGGQVRLTATSPRRREMIGIIDWRMAQCEARDVRFHFDAWAEPATVSRRTPGPRYHRDRRFAAHGGPEERR